VDPATRVTSIARLKSRMQEAANGTCDFANI
jgi:hypothetical protein